MAGNPDPYLDTLDRMEPDIAAIDAAAGWASIAISLKRIADALDTLRAFIERVQAEDEAQKKGTRG